VRRLAALYATYVKIGWKSLLSYRANFFLTSLTTILEQFLVLFFISLVFGNMTRLEGWTLHEVILIYGFLATARGLAIVFLNAPWHLAGYLHAGGLDLLLVRPVSPLFQMIAEGSMPLHSTGTLVGGIAAIVYAVCQAGELFRPWWLLYVPFAALSGSFIVFGVNSIVSCLQFWVTDARSLMDPIQYVLDFARFPVTIYSLPVRAVLTWVVPYAMAGFYPAAFLLRGAPYRTCGLVAPFVGVAFLGIAAVVWRFALKRYKSTGS
jgi:ABC-2 type transport system permease protein